ncbi:hypothetical protein [Nonomuraea maheshkhaliensis]
MTRALQLVQPDEPFVEDPGKINPLPVGAFTLSRITVSTACVVISR